MAFKSTESALRDRIISELNGAESLPELMHHAQELLPRLIPATYMALCIVTPNEPLKYDWTESAAPAGLLDNYGEEHAKEDFVLKAVSRKPDRVLQDTEMLPQKELVRSPFYLRSRELDLGLERVTAVLMDLGQGVYAGLAMYRNYRERFSDKSCDHFQALVPHFKTAVRNARRTAMDRARAALLDARCKRQGTGYLVLEPTGRARMGSAQTATLLEKWFPGAERTRSGVPLLLMNELAARIRMDPAVRAKKRRWRTSKDGESLVVTFTELHEPGCPGQWALELDEFSRSLPMPEDWRGRLSEREAEVVEKLLSPLETDDIAEELRIKRSTLKTHVRNIFKDGRLGFEDRADLMYHAAQFLKPI